MDPVAGRAGWSSHHLADSETMAYTRLRRLIAEDEPLIQDTTRRMWSRRLHYERPIETSLEVLQAVRGASEQHYCDALSPEEWARTGTHSEGGPYSVANALTGRSAGTATRQRSDPGRRARRAVTPPMH